MKKALTVSLMVLMFFSFVALSGANELERIDRSALIRKALDVQSRSYAPYSHFNVAAAALFDSGEI